MMQPLQTESLVTLAVAAVIVFRFVRRELRGRIVRRRTLWIRPVLLVVILAVSIAGTLHLSPYAVSLLSLAVVVGALLGAVTGGLVLRSTTYSAAGIPGAVRAQGSRATAAIWIGAFLLRILARLFVSHTDRAAQLALNSGLLALIAVAFAVVAIGFYRAIAAFSTSAV